MAVLEYCGSLMPSPLGHAIAGVAAGWLVLGAPSPGVGRPARRRFAGPYTWEAGWLSALALAPDLDLLAGVHSGPTHSLGAAAIVGVCLGLAARATGSRRAGRLGLAGAFAYASHVLLDWLGRDGTPPIGIMALWPVTRDHYEAGVHVFMGISRRHWQGWSFVRHNLAAIARELLILVPLLLLVLRARRRGPADPDQEYL